jgi:hypothetical protein
MSSGPYALRWRCSKGRSNVGERPVVKVTLAVTDKEEGS